MHFCVCVGGGGDQRVSVCAKRTVNTHVSFKGGSRGNKALHIKTQSYV